MRKYWERFLLSPWLFILLLLAAFVLIPIRLLGVLWFLSDIPLLAFFPTIALAGLLVLASGMEFKNRMRSGCLLLLSYLLTLVLFGWKDAMTRWFTHGQFPDFDLVEALCILLLFVRVYVMETPSGPDSDQQRGAH